MAGMVGQKPLITSKRKGLLPVVLQRQQLVDSLARILGQLGLERKAKPVLNLQNYLAKRRSPAGEAGPDQDAPR